MNKYPFIYKATFLDLHDKEKQECGIVFADTYAEAMARIEKYYGDTIIAMDYIFGMDEGPVIISEEVMHNLIKGAYEGYEIPTNS